MRDRQVFDIEQDLQELQNDSYFNPQLFRLANMFVGSAGYNEWMDVLDYLAAYVTEAQKLGVDTQKASQLKDEIYQTFFEPVTRRNPITPNRLVGVLTMAIWPNPDPRDPEAATAKATSIRLLGAVTVVDLDQLKIVLLQVMDGPGRQTGSMPKLRGIYTVAAKANRNLPATLEEAAGIKTPPTPKPASAPKPSPASKAKPKFSSSSPPPPPPPPRPSEACRACDGSGVRKKVDKENVLRETVTTCSRCGGSGKEPVTGPPKKGRGGWGRRPQQPEDEDEKDVNKAADNFLRRHGLDRWGRP